MYYVAAAVAPAKVKGGSTTPQTAKMPASVPVKSNRVEKPKEKKVRSSGHSSHRPKTHEALHREQAHRPSQRAHALKSGAASDGLRDGPKEIPHEVVRDRHQDMSTLLAAQAGLHPHRDVARRPSGGSTAHRSSMKHLEEPRGKPVPGYNPLPSSHRLSSDARPLAGHSGIDARSSGGQLKVEGKLATKVSLVTT